MGKYVLVETRDPFDSADVDNSYQLAQGLAGAGDDVTVFLVQNGVLAARAGSAAADKLRLLTSATNVLADDFSLRERGIRADELAEGVTPAQIDDLVDLVAPGGCKVIWH
jgi:sulfur relay protein TusB/DsrH